MWELLRNDLAAFCFCRRCDVMVERCMDEDRELINQEFMQLKSEIDRIANDTEFNGNKVLNGNISGKEYEVKQGTNTNTAGITNDNLKAIFAGTGEELLKLGEGTFEFKLTHAAQGDAVTIELFDNSEFNGGKKYLLDSFTLDTPKADETFELGGITLNLKDLDSKIDTGKSGGFTFSNEVKVEEEGIRLQVGANREQMIGLSVGNMRSRELGLGGIDVIGVGNAEEAIERIDEAISRVSSQRADLGAAQNRLEHTIASTDNTPEESIRYVGDKLYRDELDKNEILYIFWLIYFQLGYCLRNEYKFEKLIKYGL